MLHSLHPKEVSQVLPRRVELRAVPHSLRAKGVSVQCTLNRCTHSQLFRSALNFWSTLVRTISASSVIGIVTTALHDGMIGGAMPAANTSLRAGLLKTITACVAKAAVAVARATQTTAHDHVKSASLFHACKGLTKRCRDEVLCARAAGAPLRPPERSLTGAT